MHSTIKVHNHKKLFALSVLTLALNQAVYAEELATDENTTTLPEITISAERDVGEGYAVPVASTGTKTDTPIMETPMAIQIVPQAILQERRVHSITEAVRNVSGITPGYGAGSTAGDNFNLRGFNHGDATYEDGAKMSNGAAVALPRSMANIEQVEVIKGPASILYGQGEPGGLVNNITKKPLDYNFSTITQEVGSFDRLYTTADATGPLNQTSTLLYRLNLAYENAGSFRDFVDSKRFDVFPTLQWKISPKTQVTTQLHYGNGYAYLGDTGIPMMNGQHVDIPRSRNFSEPDLNRNNVDEYSVKVSWTHDFNDHWKVSNYFKLEDITACKNGLFMAYPTADPAANGDVQRGLAWLYYNGTKTWNASLNLTGKFEASGIKHTLLTGVDYYRLNEFFAGGSSSEFDSVTGDLISNHFPPINIFHPIYNQPRDPLYTGNDFMVDHIASAYGVYVQDQIELPHKVFLLLGLRHDRAVDRSNLDVNAANPYPPYDYPTFRDQPPLSHRYGLLWQMRPELSFYTSYTENFGASAFGQIQFDGGRSPGETAQQYEVGAKTELFDKRLTGSTSIYQLTKQNVLATDPVHGTPFVIPLGEVRTRGFEMDVNGEVTPSWNLTAAYTYIDGQTTKADPVELLGRTQGVPYNRISLWSTHTLKGKLKGLKLGGGIETQSSQLDYFKNHLAGYATAELFASYGWRIKQKNVSAQLNISNLFDQQYYASTDNIPGEPLKAIATFTVEL